MHRTKRLFALIVGFAVTNYVVLGGWYYLFGYPTGGMRFLALAIALAAWRIAYLAISSRFPARPTG
jgi:hypothetical protein